MAGTFRPGDYLIIAPVTLESVQAGDVIVKLGDMQVGSIQDLFGALAAHSPGDAVEIEVLRDGERRTLEAVLGESPSEPSHGKPE